jgi:HSP20 family protein
MNIVRYQRNPQPELPSAFNRLSNLREEMDRLFDASFGPFFGSTASFSGWSPALDVYEDKDQFTVVAELPGFKKDQVEISLHQGALTISGERKPESQGKDEGLRSERYFGRFQRTVTLPAEVNAEGVRASLQDGILKIELPKAEEAKPKQIEVSVS